MVIDFFPSQTAMPNAAYATVSQPGLFMGRGVPVPAQGQEEARDILGCVCG